MKLLLLLAQPGGFEFLVKNFGFFFFLNPMIYFYAEGILEQLSTSEIKKTFVGPNGTKLIADLHSDSNDFTWDDNGGSITITGGTISSIDFRDEDGSILATLSGGSGVSAAQFASEVFSPDSGTYPYLVSLLDTDTTVTGGPSNDGIEVGAGNDTVTGGDGDDFVFKWKTGALDFNGGNGSDTVAFCAATGTINPLTGWTTQLVVDLGQETGTNPFGGGTLTLKDVENVIGTDHADSLTGSDEANIFGDGLYDSGADVIHALGGNDIVSLAEGNNPTNHAAVQADGGAGIDTLSINFAQIMVGLQKLDLANQANNAGVFGNGVFINFEIFVHGQGFFSSIGQTFTFVDNGESHAVEAMAQTNNLSLGGGNDTAILLSSIPANYTVSANGGTGSDTLQFEVKSSVANNVLDLLHPANNSGTFANSTFTGFERFVHVEADGGYTLSQRFTFRGDANAQTVTGAYGIDDIRTAGGDDVLNGGLGKDILGGGTGKDTFIFNTAKGPANVDQILDFSVPNDTIKLENAIFAGIGGNGQLAAIRFHVGPHAHDANDRIVYNANTGALLYDSNGNAAGHEIAFAILAKHLAVTAADFIVN